MSNVIQFPIKHVDIFPLVEKIEDGLCKTTEGHNLASISTALAIILCRLWSYAEVEEDVADFVEDIQGCLRNINDI
jgi:hypothetical protein